MSLRQVLTVFNIERQLNDDETALLNALRGWTDAEREMFINALSDKPQKKSSKKGAGKGGGKSKREVSLRQQIGSVVQGSGNNLQPRCTAIIDDNGGDMECGETVDNNVHHKKTDPDYHPFVPPAQPADDQSSANGVVINSTASSETEKSAAGVAHHGSSGGD